MIKMAHSNKRFGRFGDKMRLKRKEGATEALNPNDSELTEKLGMKGQQWTQTALSVSRP